MGTKLSEKCCMIPFIYPHQNGKIIELRNR
jgi:hypothetical protein